MTVLTVVVAALGLLQLHLAQRQASILATRSTAAGFLASAQSDIAQSRGELETAVFASQDAELLATVPRALTQAQAGVAEWSQYKKAVRLWGPLSTQAVRLDDDIAALTAAAIPAAPTSAVLNSAASTTAGLPAVDAAQSQLQLQKMLAVDA